MLPSQGKSCLCLCTWGRWMVLGWQLGPKVGLVGGPWAGGLQSRSSGDDRSLV